MTDESDIIDRFTRWEEVGVHPPERWNRVEARHDGRLVGSRLDIEGAGPPLHGVAIDLDLPATMVPSSTPGHHHLYIHAPMTWAEYSTLLRALRDARVISNNYFEMALERKQSMLRAPGVTKKDMPLTAKSYRRPIFSVKREEAELVEGWRGQVFEIQGGNLFVTDTDRRALDALRACRTPEEVEEEERRERAKYDNWGS